MKQSKNFFSALDDSDDEAAPAPQKVDTTKKKEPTKQQKVVVPKKAPIIVEPSKSSSQPNQAKRHNHDRKHGGRGAPSSAAREGKRTFDRRSGTGRGKEIKKDGGGAHNWGSNKNLARSAQGMVLENNNNETTEEETKEEEEEVTTTPVEEPPKEEEEQEEDKTLSYDEYMKQKARPENELFAPVKERQVENEFANLQPKVAVAEDFLVMEGTKGRKKKGVRNVEKKTLDVEFRVAASEKEHDRKPRRDDDRRGRGGRSGDGRGRGGGGGGRGRGDGRGRGRAEGRGVRGAGGGGGQKGSTGINVNDSSAFPSL